MSNVLYDMYGSDYYIEKRNSPTGSNIFWKVWRYNLHWLQLQQADSSELEECRRFKSDLFTFDKTCVMFMYELSYAFY